MRDKILRSPDSAPSDAAVHVACCDNIFPASSTHRAEQGEQIQAVPSVLTLCFSKVRLGLHCTALNLGALISFVVGTKL